MDNWQTTWLKRGIFLCTLLTVAFLFSKPLLVVAILLVIHSLYFLITQDKSQFGYLLLGWLTRNSCRTIMHMERCLGICEYQFYWSALLAPHGLGFVWAFYERLKL